VKHSLLDLLVCPNDRLPLTSSHRDESSEIRDATLTCEGGHAFRVDKGVPRMLSDEMLAEQQKLTQASFSAKWKRIPKFGHEDASRNMYVSWYLQRYGFGTIENLRAFLANKRTVLDAGTGLGRDALLYGENCPGQVYALDLSTSIDDAYQHVGHMPNVHLIQGDLTQLPFREGTFDFIACDQVIHHTPDAPAAFQHLAAHLAPGGEIAIYVYKKKGPIREFCDDFLRAHYTTASEEECYAFSRAMTNLGKALTDLNIELDVPEDIPILGIKAGKQNLQRFIYWNVFKCYWNDDLDFETNVMTNFDWYHPFHASRHTEEELRSWCATAGLDIVHFDVIESGISFRARCR
jgi:ubiquinone/menaquinone biosynthesis C-methylase UbiE